MKQTARWTKLVLVSALAVVVFGFIHQARAADLPLAAASPMTGVAFDDRPLLLPVQRNFQMAMLTAGSELGRSCGRMEAYGWRMSQTEQARVNQIFNNTVDRLRLLGYSIEPQTLTSVSKDITLFTADHNDKHFIFLWSAGELGLVLNLCETSAPIPSTYRPTPIAPSVQTFPVPMDVVPAGLEKMGSRDLRGFTPVGKWVGGYTCAQGYTGGTLEISHLHGENFDGEFRFYPTTKNPNVPLGSYTVYGQYDPESKRILINPGKWIKRPPNFYNTVIVGGFDAVTDNFSAYFQGINGCTSFEARRLQEPSLYPHEVRAKKKKHHVKKKAPVKKPASTSISDVMAPVPPPISPPAPTSSVPASPSGLAPIMPEPKVPAAAAAQMPAVGTPAPLVPAAPAAPSSPTAAIKSPVLAPSPIPPEPPAVPGADDKGILLATPPPPTGSK